jgi:hypothetical protein
MKKHVAFSMIAIAAGILLLSTTAWARGHVAQHQRQQMQRIEQGFAKGDLTAKEYRLLLNEQRQIRQATQRALSDGRLQPGEKYRLGTQLARAGRHIYREKHDRHYRHHCRRRHHHDCDHHRYRGRDRHRYYDRDRPRHRYRHHDRRHYHYHYRGRPSGPRIIIPLPPPPPFWF